MYIENVLSLMYSCVPTIIFIVTYCNTYTFIVNIYYNWRHKYELKVPQCNWKEQVLISVSLYVYR